MNNLIGRKVKVGMHVNKPVKYGSDRMIYGGEVVTIHSVDDLGMIDVEKANGIIDSGGARLFTYLNNKPVVL